MNSTTSHDSVLCCLPSRAETMAPRNVLWTALVLALVATLVAPAQAVTGFSNSTCVEPITDERLEIISNPTPLAGEAFGFALAARGRLLAVADSEIIEALDIIHIYRRDTTLDLYDAAGAYQLLSPPGAPMTAGVSDIAHSIAMDDRWIVSGGAGSAPAIYIFEYATGPSTYGFHQTIASPTGETIQFVAVFCDRIIAQTSPSVGTLYQYIRDPISGLFIAHPTQPTIPSSNAGIIDGQFNEFHREFVHTTTAGFQVWGFETCCSDMVLTQPPIVTAAAPVSLDIDFVHRIAVGMSSITTVSMYARSLAGIYSPDGANPPIVIAESGFGFALSFSEVDGALIINAPFVLISAAPIEFGRYHVYHETAGTYTPYMTYTQSAPISADGFTFGFDASDVPVQTTCGDYAFFGEWAWDDGITPGSSEVGRVQTFCLSDEYCCGTCGNACDLDDNMCTVDTCVETPIYGNVTHTMGVCTAGPALDVNDDNPCTVDTCDPVLGARHIPLYSGSCTDPTGCFTGVCDCGTCVNATTPIDCSDGDICTDDICLPGGICFNPLNMTICPTPTPTPTTSPSSTTSASPSTSLSNTPSTSLSSTPTPSLSAGVSASNTPSTSPSASNTPSTSLSNTPSTTPSASITPSVSASAACNPNLCPLGGDECQVPICVNATTCGFDSAPTEGFACGAELDDACVYNHVCVSGTCTPLTNITDSDCNDNNECTIDSCDPVQGCVFNATAAAGNSCSPLGGVALSVCFLEGVCDGFGGCVANLTGPQTDCEDGHDCTHDWCDSVAGCLHVGNDTKCTQDNNDCTRSVCTEAGCVTINVADGSGCSDGFSCTTNDHCEAGVCVGTEDSDFCADTDECNLGVCDISLFVGANGTGCIDSFASPGAACPNLGNECLRDGVCDGAGTCGNFTVLDCNDFNSCTDQVCDPILGCVYTPEPIGQACTFLTGGVCLLDGACSANGTCITNPFGPHMDCDDGLTCTVDRCDLDIGCFFEANHTACASLDSGHQCTEYVCDPSAVGPDDGCVIANKTDGTFCVETGVDTCSHNGQCMGGACITVPEVSLCAVNGSNPCQVAECLASTNITTGDTITGCVVSDLADGTECVSPSETECIKDFECTSGACVSTTTLGAAECTDGNECTVDSCDDLLGCVHTPVSAGTTCAGLNVTTNLCFLDSVCNDIGVCIQNVTGPQVDCDDGVDCTIDRCDSVNNCTHTPDHDFCGVTGNLCTEYTCDLVLGCVANNLTDGTPCNDFSGCTGNDACVEGRCVGEGLNHRCPDLNDCSTGFCLVSMGINATSGICTFANETVGTPCGNEDECNKDLECNGMGVCEAQTVLNGTDCDDGNPCTVDTCDDEKGCVHETLSLLGVSCGVQVINTNGTCFLNNTCDGFGSCLPDLGASTIECGDGVNCTRDFCDGVGTCQHTVESENCPPDPGPCSMYECDEILGCILVNATDGSGCSDGFLCTSDDTCQGGICVGTANDENCPNLDECVVGVCAPFHGSADSLGCIPGFLIGFPVGVPCPSFDTECSVDGVCDGAGSCVNQTDISTKCDDFNSCTDDVCHPVTGCSNPAVAPAGTSCNTAALGLCWLDAVCSVNGTCVTDFTGATTPCNDTIECTVDTCDSVNGCVFTEDNDFCNTLTPSSPCKKFVCDGSATGNTTGCVEVNKDEGEFCVEFGGDCSINGQCDDAGLCIAEANDGACPSPAEFPCLEGFCNITTSGVNGTISFCDTRDLPNAIPCDSPDETECLKDFECDTGVCVAQTNTTDADCNDNNPCTTNVCDPELGCVTTNLPYGTDCGFLNITNSICFLDSICNGIGGCIANLEGAQLNCTDLVECTVDGCDSVSNCTHAPDHDFCPDTGNPCTQSLCTGTSGTGCEVSNRADGTFCPAPADDECSTNYQCLSGVCTGTREDELCTDADFCNLGLCSVGTPAPDGTTVGTCATQFAANGTFCRDNDGCNFDYTCDGSGTCSPLTTITDQDCIDQALVTDECAMTECRPYHGCVSCPINQNQTCTSTPFQDDLCFLDTVCNDYAQCVWDPYGESMDCLDAYSCTEDVCDSVLGCQNIPRHDWCVQPTFGCAKAVCNPIISTDSTGCVLEQLPNDARCNDGYTCTDNDVCVNGTCVGTPQHLQCDNDLINDCKVGFCNPTSREPNFDYYFAYWDHENPQGFMLTEASGCEFQPAVNDTKCYSTLDECNLEGLCKAGFCIPQVVLNGTDCDDGNDCTIDECDPQLGCTHTPVAFGSPCAVISEVNHLCFIESECNDYGTCVPNIKGNITDCEPPAQCMDSTCDSVYGCVFTANNTKCPVSQDPCHEWVCRPGATLDPLGCVYVAREEGSDCETGSACLMDGSCDAEAICRGKPVHDICDRDNLECSVDLCAEDPNDPLADELGCLPPTLLDGPCMPRDSCMQDGVCDASTFQCNGENPVICETNRDLEFGFCIEGECFFDEIEPESPDCGWFYFRCIWPWLLAIVLFIIGLFGLNVLFNRWMLRRENRVERNLGLQPLESYGEGRASNKSGGGKKQASKKKRKKPNQGAGVYEEDSLLHASGNSSSRRTTKKRNGSRMVMDDY